MQVNNSRIPLGGAAAVGAAVAANVIVWLILGAILEYPAGFPPLSIGAIIFFTAFGLAAATGVFALVNRLSDQPYRVFTIVAVVVLIVSIIPNLIASGNPAMFPLPNATGQAFLILITFHFVAALAGVGALYAVTRQQ
ncbi:MAG: hypothetical protein GYB64_02270 [Chloroflexi bacterium]|nr:hypothetical protein [Chloroflexota bacterium]